MSTLDTFVSISWVSQWCVYVCVREKELRFDDKMHLFSCCFLPLWFIFTVRLIDTFTRWKLVVVALFSLRSIKKHYQRKCCSVVFCDVHTLHFFLFYFLLRVLVKSCSFLPRAYPSSQKLELYILVSHHRFDIKTSMKRDGRTNYSHDSREWSLLLVTVRSSLTVAI